MGSCFSCTTPTIRLVALKFPNGTSGIEYQNEFVRCDINIWLRQLYENSNWLFWQVYNDETGHIGDNHHKKGHCKGIVAWNNKRISWLCHSVPNFPRTFEGNRISEIEPGELIYGQSFQYIEIDYSLEMIRNILKQIRIMEAQVYINTYMLEFVKCKSKISVLKLSDTITHFAKSPHHNIDIYDYLCNKYNRTWKVESWIRGHKIEQTNTIVDITSLQFEDIKWTESQDHSKWATTEHLYWIGDLNRMTSQYKRGGGGFVCQDTNLALAFNKLII